MDELQLLTLISEQMATIQNILAVFLWAIFIFVSVVVARWLLNRVILAIIKKSFKMPM